MATKKAGCVLFNENTKQVALVYRDIYNDYSFPKGHLEKDETLEECAIRETAEETKRIAFILKDIPFHIEKYVTPKGEKCECYMYLAIDKGKSDNSSLETHPTIWIDFDEVENKLSYESVKNTWRFFKKYILNYNI